ncbi:hypothetical protein [Desulforamulus profundi]|nr:hypothetical protein [Desulforamulus profundi]
MSKNQDITEVNITIRNETGYDFLPSGVFLKPYIMTETNDNTYKKEPTPILFEAVLNTTSEDKKCLTYKVFLPNSFLQPLQFLEQNSFDIDIRGYFLNQKGIIISSISGYGGVIEIK